MCSAQEPFSIESAVQNSQCALNGEGKPSLCWKCWLSARLGESLGPPAQLCNTLSYTGKDIVPREQMVTPPSPPATEEREAAMFPLQDIKVERSPWRKPPLPPHQRLRRLLPQLFTGNTVLPYRHCLSLLLRHVILLPTFLYTQSYVFSSLLSYHGIRVLVFKTGKQDKGT